MVIWWLYTVPLGRLDEFVLTIDTMSINDASDDIGNDDGGELEGHFNQSICPLPVAAIMQLQNIIAHFPIKIYDQH